MRIGQARHFRRAALLFAVVAAFVLGDLFEVYRTGDLIPLRDPATRSATLAPACRRPIGCYIQTETLPRGEYRSIAATTAL